MGGAMADVKSIFGRALEIPTLAERAAYLEEACGGDARLRAEVESLLQAGDEAGGFFDRLKLPPAQTIDQPRLAEGPARSSAPTSCWSRSAKAAWDWSLSPSSSNPSAARWR